MSVPVVFFLFISVMKAHDNILKSRTSSIEKYYKDDYRENIITWNDFHVADCIGYTNVS